MQVVDSCIGPQYKVMAKSSTFKTLGFQHCDIKNAMIFYGIGSMDFRDIKANSPRCSYLFHPHLSTRKKFTPPAPLKQQQTLSVPPLM
jgi:hypothetical protein